MNVEQFLIEGHTPINYQTKYISTYPSIFKIFKNIYNFPKKIKKLVFLGEKTIGSVRFLQIFKSDSYFKIQKITQH